MLEDNVGFNVSPTAWDQYPTIGRNGTFVTDQQGVMRYFEGLSATSEAKISRSMASQIEKDMGLVPGTLQDGFKVRQVTGLRSLNPASSLEGINTSLALGTICLEGHQRWWLVAFRQVTMGPGILGGSTDAVFKRR